MGVRAASDLLPNLFLFFLFHCGSVRQDVSPATVHEHCENGRQSFN